MERLLLIGRVRHRLARHFCLFRSKVTRIQQIEFFHVGRRQTEVRFEGERRENTGRIQFFIGQKTNGQSRGSARNVPEIGLEYTVEQIVLIGTGQGIRRDGRQIGLVRIDDTSVSSTS